MNRYAMASELIINVTSHETRVALMENGILSELHIERESDKGIAGNIYKGRIQRVLPGMQAAFVDIGLARSAFLYVDDVYTSRNITDPLRSVFKDEQDDPEPEDDDKEEPQQPHSIPIEELISDGQEILVQVMKEPIGTKGARISSYISLPGRYLVYLPGIDNIAISRRITDETERERLEGLVRDIRQDTSGFIVRTASEGAHEDELRMDMDFLLKLWDSIQMRSPDSAVPGILHEDLSVSLRAIRDLYSNSIKKIIVDSQQTYQRIINFIETFTPQLKFSVELYDNPLPIFDSLGIALEISRALNRNVWLKSGGYIVIEQTEALFVIDVNTGRYVGKRNQADTILKTNLEAVKEIAYQIRLRNLGGIIIVDFIDMEKKADRQAVLDTLQEALKKDRTKTNVSGISDLGLVQMTRKRVRENLRSQMCDPCPHCEGRGTIKSTRSITYDILRAVRKEAGTHEEEKVLVLAHPDVVAFLYDEERDYIDEIENLFHKKIVIRADNRNHNEKFDVFSH
jgi:ribonuclease G